MRKRVFIPAISREVEFIALHVTDADDIYYEKVPVNVSIRELTKAVYDRADVDVQKLLHELQEKVSNELRGLVRVEWARSVRGSWEHEGTIYTARGRKRRIGWIGLQVGYGKLAKKLIGWVFPQGGLDGRKEYVRKCKPTMPEVQLVSEHVELYPGWNDCVVWYKENLTAKTSRNDLHRDVAARTKKHFKLGVPILKALAAR